MRTFLSSKVGKWFVVCVVVGLVGFAGAMLVAGYSWIGKGGLPRTTSKNRGTLAGGGASAELASLRQELAALPGRFPQLVNSKEAVAYRAVWQEVEGLPEVVAASQALQSMLDSRVLACRPGLSEYVAAAGRYEHDRLAVLSDAGVADKSGRLAELAKGPHASLFNDPAMRTAREDYLRVVESLRGDPEITGTERQYRLVVDRVITNRAPALTGHVAERARFQNEHGALARRIHELNRPPAVAEPPAVVRTEPRSVAPPVHKESPRSVERVASASTQAPEPERTKGASMNLGAAVDRRTGSLMEASGTAEEGRGPKDSFDRIGEAVLGGLLRCSIAMLTQSPSHRGTGLPPTAGMVAKVFGRSAPPAASVPIIAQLKIRGLAISRGKSTVLINDQTVRPGETVDIRLADRQARLSCIEIRPGRAVVKIDGGAPEELLLE